jgi:hypothetical protein
MLLYFNLLFQMALEDGCFLVDNEKEKEMVLPTLLG